MFICIQIRVYIFFKAFVFKQYYIVTLKFPFFSFLPILLIPLCLEHKVPFPSKTNIEILELQIAYLSKIILPTTYTKVICESLPHMCSEKNILSYSQVFSFFTNLMFWLLANSPVTAALPVNISTSPFETRGTLHLSICPNAIRSLSYLPKTRTGN